MALHKKFPRSSASQLAIVKDVFIQAIKKVREYCNNDRKMPHMGALYAILGICYLEEGNFREGLAWLAAAEAQDKSRKDYSGWSYATGKYDPNDNTRKSLFFQWLDVPFGGIPSRVVVSISSTFNVDFVVDDFYDFCNFLRKRGQLEFLGGVIDYSKVRDDDTAHGLSVKWSCLRNLASLFEVLVKTIGSLHKCEESRNSLANHEGLAKA